jgi:hypothetical protein
MLIWYPLMPQWRKYHEANKRLCATWSILPSEPQGQHVQLWCPVQQDNTYLSRLMGASTKGLTGGVITWCVGYAPGDNPRYRRHWGCKCPPVALSKKTTSISVGCGHADISGRCTDVVVGLQINVYHIHFYTCMNKAFIPLNISKKECTSDLIKHRFKILF